MSDDFDPKAYLAAKAAEAETAFDPKAYLSAKGVATRATPTRADAALAGIQNLGSFGWGDELGAALQGGLAKLYGTGEYGETYRQARDENRRQSAAAKEAHKGVYYASGLPFALAASAALPGFKAAQGAGLGMRALVGAANGALQGGLAGAGESEADTLGGVAKDAGVGAALGGGVGGVLPVVGSVASSAVRGVVKPGALVRTLQRLGVDTNKLTLGQMNPEGAMAQMEEAGQHAIGSGKVIEAQREAGNQAWRDAVLKRALAPGATPGAGGTAEKLAQAYEGFTPAYEAVTQTPIASAGPMRQSMGDQLRSAFRSAVGDEGVLATEADRAAVARYLDNQASALHFQPGETPSVGDLHAVRSNVGKVLRKALRGSNPNQAQADLLTNAEEAISQKMAENLSPKDLSALRAVDKQYGAYKTVEDAVARAGDTQQGLMPQHLSAAIKGVSPRSAYARGAGGDLRDLAVAGAEALQTKTPPTGVRALMQLVPGSHYVQAPLAALANTGGVKRALLGQTAAQLKTQALVDALRGTLGTELTGAAERSAPTVLPDFIQALRGNP
jgi:hypothetical protein